MHEDAALKCISWLIVMKCSAMPISELRYQLPVILLKPYSHYIIQYDLFNWTDLNMHRNYTFSVNKNQFAFDSHSSITWSTVQVCLRRIRNHKLQQHTVVINRLICVWLLRNHVHKVYRNRQHQLSFIHHKQRTMLSVND